MDTRIFREITASVPSLGSLIDARVVVSFDFVTPRDFITQEDSGNIVLKSEYEPLLRLLICYEPTTRCLVPVLKNIRPQNLDNFAVLAPDDISGIASSENISIGNLAHIRCMESPCPKRYRPGEHVKIYQSFETAKPFKLYIDASKVRPYIIYAVQALIASGTLEVLPGFFSDHYPEIDSFGSSSTLSYLIDLYKLSSFYPNQTIFLGTHPLSSNLVSHVGKDRSYLSEVGDRIVFNDEPETLGMCSISCLHFLLDNGIEENPKDNNFRCAPCVEVDYIFDCYSGAGRVKPSISHCLSEEDSNALGSCYNVEMGICDLVTEEQCLGEWTINKSCSPVPCESINLEDLGGCCNPETGDCQISTQLQCLTAWIRGSTCGENVCEVAALEMGWCLDPTSGLCEVTDRASCVGEWTLNSLPVVGLCYPITLEDVGGCCNPAAGVSSSEEGCTETTQSQCEGEWTRGRWCSDENPCNRQPPPELGGCYDSTSGHCEVTDRASCVGEWTLNSLCSPTTCVTTPDTLYQIYIGEYLSCWPIDRKVCVYGEEKIPSELPPSTFKSVKTEIIHHGTDRWARNWIQVSRADLSPLDLTKTITVSFSCPGSCSDPEPAEITGACCRWPNSSQALTGDCTIETEAACIADEGTYQGDDTACEPNPCAPPPPPTGACCHTPAVNNSGTTEAVTGRWRCTIEEGWWCTGYIDGTYQGNGTVCGPNPCDLAVLTCCDGFNCTETTLPECSLLTGSSWGDASVCVDYIPTISGQQAPGLPPPTCGVPPPPPPPATGACCNRRDPYEPLSWVCTTTTEAGCLTAEEECLQFPATCSFSWTEGASCSNCLPTPPPSGGACCTENGCESTTQIGCVNLGGEFIGFGIGCNPSPCGGAGGTRACCGLGYIPGVGYPCAETTLEGCENIGGVWQDAGVYCSSWLTCQPPAMGACCDAFGACTIQREAVCLAVAGSTWSDGDICTPNPCGAPPPPTGACCATDGTCATTTAANCAAPSTFAYATCFPNPCAQPPPPTGSCCYSTVSSGGGLGCQETTQAECLTNPIRLTPAWTQGAVCWPNPCVDPMGTCCGNSNGACEDMTGPNCPSNTSIWTIGQTCAANPCTVPPGLGACCAGGGCVGMTTEAACGSPSWRAGLFCFPDPCVEGSCCTLDPMGAGVCEMTTDALCFGQFYPDANCNTNPCPPGAGGPFLLTLTNGHGTDTVNPTTFYFLSSAGGGNFASGWNMTDIPPGGSVQVAVPYNGQPNFSLIASITAAVNWLTGPQTDVSTGAPTENSMTIVLTY